MEATEWNYINEGGKHALFSYSRSRSYNNNNNDHNKEQQQQEEGEDPHDNDDDEDHDDRQWQSWRMMMMTNDDDDSSKNYLLRVQKQDLRDSFNMMKTTMMELDDPTLQQHHQQQPKQPQYHHPSFCLDDSDTMNIDGDDYNDYDDNENESNDSTGEGGNSGTTTVNYTSDIIAPCLGNRFVDVPITIPLNWNFLNDLRCHTVRCHHPSETNDCVSNNNNNSSSSSRIPAARWKDWIPSSSKNWNESNSSHHRHQRSHRPYGQLIVDYRSTPYIMNSTTTVDQRHETNNNHDHRILFTMEIKPKAGYLAWTPFVQPTRRNVKYTTSRFVSLQRLHSMGLWTKGWDTVTSTTQSKPITTNTNTIIIHDDDTTTNHNYHTPPPTTTRRRTTNTTTKQNTSKTLTISRYDPLDLFSIVVDDDTTKPTVSDNNNDDGHDGHHGHNHNQTHNKATRLRTAISNLVRTPQNNLRCFFNGEPNSILQNCCNDDNDGNDNEHGDNDDNGDTNKALPTTRSRTTHVDVWNAIFEEHDRNADHTNGSDNTGESIRNMITVYSNKRGGGKGEGFGDDVTAQTLSTSTEFEDNNDNDDECTNQHRNSPRRTATTETSDLIDTTKPSKLDTVLEDIIVQVFSSDDGTQLLSRLLSLQKLDILDVDGAGIVYNRLVHLLGKETDDDNNNDDDVISGSSGTTINNYNNNATTTTDEMEIDSDHFHRIAQKLLDRITPHDLKVATNSELVVSNERTTVETNPSVHRLLSQSPFKYPNEHNTNNNNMEEKVDLIYDLCTEIEQFQNNLAKYHPKNLPPENEMDRARQRCLDIVHQLNITECRYLLLNWLLSLSACDVSIFIMIRKIRTSTVDDSNRKECINKEDHDDDKDDDNDNKSKVCHLSFELRVIDTDQKPSTKIRSKQKNEVAFDAFHEWP